MLYNVANAEQHFFAELDGKRIKRFVWIQFEGYVPSSHGRYDYSADTTISLWNRPIFMNASFRGQPATEQRPESDGARRRPASIHPIPFLRERGLSFPSPMLYHRFVSVLDKTSRNELMIIYMEDPSIYGASAATLSEDPTEPRLRGLLELSLQSAARRINVSF